MSISYELLATDGQARRGVVHTAHGDIQTPAFMPVGTAATVKGLLPDMVKQTGADIVLGNTYHLMLRPGADRVEEMGGLRNFMQWDGPVLTDSGGFQVMSLSKLRKITEEGVEFQSHIDGKKIMLTPEESIRIQHKLGATITMAFDECTPFPATEEEARASMELSMRWAERSKAAFVPRDGHALFGIVQGGIYPHLREESAKRLVEIGFDGYAIGGLAVGEGQELMLQTIEATIPHLPSDKPRYLMGVGTPSDLTEAVKRGIDMFDCVIPTRAGRFGRAYTNEGEINIKNAKFAADPEPIDPSLDIPQLNGFSRAYVNHLFKADEMLGPMLLSWHNVFFYQQHMQKMREAIGG